MQDRRMLDDVTLVTRGLPAPDVPTCAQRTFEWYFKGDSLTIPKRQCGINEFIAEDHDQAQWLEAHGKAWMREVWYCTWEWNTPAMRAAFMAVLASVDPSRAEVEAALAWLGGADANGRAQAAKELLAMHPPNLAAAVPALERLQGGADGELRGLATRLLYDWYRRVDDSRLAALFRDDDPAVRLAALRQAPSEFSVSYYGSRRIPFVLERVMDADPGVRDAALAAIEAAAQGRLISGWRVFELRAEVGPLIDGVGVDRSEALIEIADVRGPNVPLEGAMAAFYDALSVWELLRVESQRGTGVGKFQDSCRPVIQACLALESLRSGLRQTMRTGFQERVSPLQRSGWRRRAAA